MLTSFIFVTANEFNFCCFGASLKKIESYSNSRVVWFNFGKIIYKEIYQTAKGFKNHLVTKSIYFTL